MVTGLVMTPLASFHWTTEQGTKLVPATFKVNVAVPAVAEAGEIEAATGAGSVVGVVVEKFTRLDVTADGKLDTEIGVIVPGGAGSVAGIAAVSCVPLTNVVGRGDPFQLTTDPLTKLVPFTVKVKPAGLQYDVEDAETEVTVGADIVNVAPTDVPPPGPSVNKKTVASPAARSSAAGTIALRYAGTVWVAGTYVVASGLIMLLALACHCTTVHGRTDVPLTLSVNAGPPAAALAIGSEGELGAGRFAVGVVIVKVTGPDVAVGLDTVTTAAPGKAASAAIIAAVSCVALTNVVARGVPFQLTTDPATKFVPFTTSVKPDEPQ
jgi:hypothetical protein